MNRKKKLTQATATVNVGYLKGKKFTDILFLICMFLYFLILNKTLQSHARTTITEILAGLFEWDNL